MSRLWRSCCDSLGPRGTGLSMSASATLQRLDLLVATHHEVEPKAGQACHHSKLIPALTMMVTQVLTKAHYSLTEEEEMELKRLMLLLPNYMLMLFNYGDSSSAHSSRSGESLGRNVAVKANSSATGFVAALSTYVEEPVQ